jgi:CheY-like chemotaxis protein
VRSTPGEGSVFRVRLFLPEVHARPWRARPPPKVRRGYEGARRKILVVDNEEADRDLLVHLLAPLGFELRTAASGHDALDLLAAGCSPTRCWWISPCPASTAGKRSAACAAWRLRRAVAIVSANAFDKGLDNDAGIRARRLHPQAGAAQRTARLAGAQLELALAAGAASTPAPVASRDTWVWPAPELLAPLQQAVQLGYYRGILNQLEAIDAAQPECAASPAPCASWRASSSSKP